VFATLCAILTLAANVVLAAQSFAGANLYYAAGLSSNQQDAYFQKLSDAGVKVLRVWLDGQSGYQKGTAIRTYNHLEQNTVGGWDDTVLNLYDDLMVKAANYGMKLLISMHSDNSLSGSNPDAYGKIYGTGGFYEQSAAIQGMQQRIFHILAHVNPHNGKTWSQCSEYIFAFEAQNEAFNSKINSAAGAQYATDHASWQCTMAQSIKSALNGNTGILVTTGGGGWLDVSMQDAYFHCDALDVLAIHAYAPGDYDTTRLKNYVTKAQQNGKKLMMQEWGTCYFNTSPNDCPSGSALDSNTRISNLKTYADQISKAGIPWMYWEIIPNNDPHQGYDYEIGVTESIYSTFQSVAKGTSGYTSAFDFSKWLR